MDFEKKINALYCLTPCDFFLVVISTYYLMLLLNKIIPRYSAHEYSNFTIRKGGDFIKIIFLDVDGVLAYEAYRNKETSNIDLEKVRLLKEICDNTDASVVISSSWRGTLDYVPDCYYVLVSILKANGIRVLGNIPNLIASNQDCKQIFTLDELDTMTEEKGTGTAAEIQAWLVEHPEVSNFIILDDLDFRWKEYGYDTHWIQPTWFGNGGLKREHVQQAIKLLNRRQQNNAN